MADDPDPTRLVLAHIDDLKPPVWVSSEYNFNGDKTGACFHCHATFLPFLQIGRISKHHCRLCGELCCRACTSKLHVPPKFEKKGKDLSRVCHACMLEVVAKRAAAGDQTMAVRLRVQKYVWGATGEPASMAEKTKLLPRMFFPPPWVDEPAVSACFKCCVVTKRHHCRACGLLFCTACSYKTTEVPQHFDHKNKPGGKRICDYCRFLMKRGWRFSEEFQKPSDVKDAYKIAPSSASAAAPLGYNPDAHTPAVRQLKPSPAAAARAASPVASRFGGGGGAPAAQRPASAQPAPAAKAVTMHVPTPVAVPATARPATATTSSASSSSSKPPVALRPLNVCSVSSCSAGAVAGGYCSAHDVTNSQTPKNTPVKFEVVLRLRFEEDIAAGEQKPWSQIEIVGHADMHAIHNAICAQHRRLDASLVTYSVRGRPASKMHWRMFEARHCVPEILIKKTAPFDHKALIAPPVSAAAAKPAPAAPAPPPRAPTRAPPRVPDAPHRAAAGAAASPTSSKSPASPTSPPSLPPRSSAIQSKVSSPRGSLNGGLTREELLAQAKPSRSVISPTMSGAATPTKRMSGISLGASASTPTLKPADPVPVKHVVVTARPASPPRRAPSPPTRQAPSPPVRAAPSPPTRTAVASPTQSPPPPARAPPAQPATTAVPTGKVGAVLAAMRAATTAATSSSPPARANGGPASPRGPTTPAVAATPASPPPPTRAPPALPPPARSPPLLPPPNREAPQLPNRAPPPPPVRYWKQQ